MLFDFAFSTLVFLVVIGIIVTVHELGHFIIARWCGVHVDVFSFGFGTELIGFTDRLGTRWRFSLIPFGGYIRIPSEDGSDAGYPMADLWRHALITIGGPVANYLFAIAGLFLIFFVYGYPVPVPKTVDQLMDALTARKRAVEYPTLIEALWLSLNQTWEITRDIIDFFVNLFLARSSVEELAGPVGIAHLSGQIAATWGLLTLVRFTFFLSIAIGFFNALPFPPLDGGRLLMYAVAWVSGGRSKRFETPYLFIGLVLVTFLFVVTTWNDVWKLIR